MMGGRSSMVTVVPTSLYILPARPIVWNHVRMSTMSHVHDDTFAADIPQNNSIFSPHPSFSICNIQTVSTHAPLQELWKRATTFFLLARQPTKTGLVVFAVASEVMKFLVAKCQRVDPHLLDFQWSHIPPNCCRSLFFILNSNGASSHTESTL